MVRSLILLCPLVLCACVTGSPERLFAIETAPDPRPEANVTGAYPKIGQVPKAQTQQFTASETAAAKAELDAAVAASRAQQTGSEQSSYQQEVEELQELGETEKQKRLEEIRKAAE